MKKIVYLMMMAAVLNMTACSSADDYWSDWTQQTQQSQQGNSSYQSSTSASGSVLASELGSFDVAVNTAALSESETIPGSSDSFYEDYVETYSPATTIKIAYNGSSASCSGEAEGVTVAINGADVTVTSTVKDVAYELSGSTSDGSFKIYSEKKFMLTLNGVSITNPTGAAINNQGKRCYLVVANGTENTLTDGTTYSTPENEDEKGTIFSEGKLAISGSGMLYVYSNGKNGIACDDYVLLRPNTNVYIKSVSNHGLKTNDGVFIKGGVLNIEVSANAVKGINTEGRLVVDGGRTTIITTGEAAYDDEDKEYKGCAAIKADSAIVINAGEVLVKSTGNGGKGISGDMTLTVNGGTVYAISSGSNYGSGNNSVSAKGIKMDGNMVVNGGEIMARSKSHEAIETKGTYTQTAGSVAAYSSDDAINSAKAMTISGGYMYGFSTGNDGIDSNGNLTVSGGVVFGCGSSAPEEGIDAAEGCTFAINGGTVIGLGGGGEAMSGSQQKASISGVTVSSGVYLYVADGNGDPIFAFQTPCSYSGATLQVSSPSFSSGTTYTLGSASTVSGSDFYGYIATPTVSNGTSLGTFTTSTSTSGGMGGGMAGSGGFPGSNGGRPGGW